MISYQGVELELYKEALRTVPARLAARARGNEPDALALVQVYHQVAKELGVPASTAWSILCTASEVTAMSLVNAVAVEQETDALEVTSRMVQAAVEQAVSGAY